MTALAAAAVGLALFLDATLGEFPGRLHPVALFGSVVDPVDRAWRAPRFVGACAAIGLPVAAAAATGGLVALALARSTAAGVALAGLALFASTSLRVLLSSAWAVIDRSDSDVEGARSAAAAVVGRDREHLGPGELRSAAVESAAENLADGLVGPLAAFALGSLLGLPLAVAAATWVKAVDTMDSMLGYETKPVGWASARLDDAAMWLPARIAAALLAVVARDPGAVRRARTDAGRPTSPNSGWPMATLATVLDVRLAKPGAYTLNATAEFPSVEVANRGVRLVGFAGVLSFFLTSLLALFAPGVLAWS